MSTKDKSLAENRLTIKELIKYYVKRYSLVPNSCDESNPSESEQIQSEYARFRIAIRRILITTFIADKTLWDIINRDGEPRKISIDEFERHCFTKWSAYIKRNNEGRYDEKKLKEDEAIILNNELLKAGVDFVYSQPIINRQRLRDTGHEMMLEAIFDIFFESFNWEQLEKDVGLDMLIDGEEETDINDDNLAARQRLEDYKNYCVKKKNWEDAENLCIQEKFRDGKDKEE